MVNQLLIRAAVAALVLVSTGCGRIALTAPGPTRAALLSPNQPMPSDLRAAEHVAREAAGLADGAALVYCGLGVYDKQGYQLDDNQATVVARFARPGGNRPAVRTVYIDFQGKAKTFWGPVDYTGVYGMHLNFPSSWLDSPADAVPLDLAKMPSARTAIGWALGAGLPGKEFLVIYQSDRTGPTVTVGQWESDGSVAQVVATKAFDVTGKALAAEEPTP